MVCVQAVASNCLFEGLQSGSPYSAIKAEITSAGSGGSTRRAAQPTLSLGLETHLPELLDSTNPGCQTVSGEAGEKGSD